MLKGEKEVEKIFLPSRMAVGRLSQIRQKRIIY